MPGLRPRLSFIYPTRDKAVPGFQVGDRVHVENGSLAVG
uniref:Uncharacterized protein n=1 Tax=Ralstonia solanacearum TaxID=305 RepID=A0A0S4V3F9_RALSL|nr:protein of unknown function [Ralstonia solanacearum]